MGRIHEKDRARLRALAQKQQEFAHDAKNDAILKQWEALGQGRRESPTVRLLFSNFTDEVITPCMQCEGEDARGMEYALLFNKEPLVGGYLRDTNVVYYSKPRAEFVTIPGPIDEEALRKYFKMVCQAASGCLFEMAQREVGTIFGDFERGRRYVQIARECMAEYWQP